VSLTPEDGTGLTNADSFVSLATANAYHAARLHNTDWTAATVTDENKEAALKWATRVLERLSWKGLRGSSTQALVWPRGYVPKRDPIDDDDYYANDAVPTFVENATSELAFRLIQLDRGADPSSLGVKRVKVGPLEKVFDVNDRNLRKMLPPEVIDMVEHALTISSLGFGRVVRV
jgi:hypothetical protein